MSFDVAFPSCCILLGTSKLDSAGSMLQSPERFALSIVGQKGSDTRRLRFDAAQQREHAVYW